MDVMTDVLGVVSGGLEALRAKATLGDLIFFSLINDYLSEEITGRFSEALNNMFGWVSGMVLIAMTLWVWWQGFLIVTGRSRESMLSFVAQAAQRVFIVSVALGASVGGTEVFNWLAEDLPREINLHQDGIGQKSLRLADAVRTITGDHHFEAFPRKVFAQGLGQLAIGLDDEHSRHGHGKLRAGRGGKGFQGKFTISHGVISLRRNRHGSQVVCDGVISTSYL